MSNYLSATLGIAVMLIASTASATARSELELASVKAATDCVAAAALNNSEITTLYRENRLREVTNWVVLRSNVCNNPLNAMRLLHDRIYGQGTGQTFLRGDYLDDLPRAVGERIKVEVLRRIVQSSNEIRGSSAKVPGGVEPTLQPISRGTELRVVQIRANDVLNMREEATNESPVVEFIPPNGQGITSLGETQGRWIFVQYDRAKGWVERRFVMPLASRGGRIP
jgi:hypothetical protein